MPLAAMLTCAELETLLVNIKLPNKPWQKVDQWIIYLFDDIRKHLKGIDYLGQIEKFE